MPDPRLPGALLARSPASGRGWGWRGCPGQSEPSAGQRRERAAGIRSLRSRELGGFLLGLGFVCARAAMNGPFSLCCHVCAGSPCAGQPQNKRSQRGTAHRAARRGWPGQPPPAGCSRCCPAPRPCRPGGRLTPCWQGPASRWARRAARRGRGWAASAALPAHSCTALAGRRGRRTGLCAVQEVAGTGCQRGLEAPSPPQPKEVAVGYGGTAVPRAGLGERRGDTAPCLVPRCQGEVGRAVSFPPAAARHCPIWGPRPHQPP